jgi:transcription elongation factor Elf1
VVSVRRRRGRGRGRRRRRRRMRMRRRRRRRGFIESGCNHYSLSERLLFDITFITVQRAVVIITASLNGSSLI